MTNMKNNIKHKLIQVGVMLNEGRIEYSSAEGLVEDLLKQYAIEIVKDDIIKEHLTEIYKLRVEHSEKVNKDKTLVWGCEDYYHDRCDCTGKYCQG
jgi:hypothetical protein